jgi:signal transduction histidine kinase
MKLGAMRGGAADTGLAPQLAEVEDLLTRAHQRTESLTFQLSPPVLHDMGLAAAAEWLAEEMERSYGLHVHVRHCAEPALAEEVRITLFRALRELLINVARHAQTGGARILMDQADDWVRLVVEDEGVGFDPEREPPGYGLFSIRQRLRHLAGEMEIEAVPGDGTRVILTAPLSAETAAGGREP